MNKSADRLHTIRREVHGDGTGTDTAFLATPVESGTDPLVRTRLVPQNGGTSEVITEFAASPTKPVSYPARLPFIPNRTVWTTESPNGQNLEGARWPGADVETLLSDVTHASTVDGWTVIPPPTRAELLGTPDVVLQRGETYRQLQLVRFEGGGLLQLWDVPMTWFDRRPSA